MYKLWLVPSKLIEKDRILYTISREGMKQSQQRLSDNRTKSAGS